MFTDLSSGGLTSGIHAEIGVLLRAAYELGGMTGQSGLRGLDLTLTVGGTRDVCPNCLQRIPEIARLLGVKSLRLVDLDTGRSFRQFDF